MCVDGLLRSGVSKIDKGPRHFLSREGAAWRWRWSRLQWRLKELLDWQSWRLVQDWQRWRLVQVVQEWRGLQRSTECLLQSCWTGAQVNKWLMLTLNLSKR